MAQEGRVTPEKQLLKLIENPDTRSTDIQAHAIKRRGLGLLSFGAWIGKFSFFRQKFGKWSGGGGFSRLDIRAANNILTVCVFALACYLIGNTYTSFMRLRKMPDMDFEVHEKIKPAALYKASILKAASFYLDKARQRNIFEIGYRESEEEDAEIVVKPSVSKIIEATEHLQLVGISWSDDPDVMIEDTRAMRTFFVKRGNMIGDVKVEAIFKDKVVLSYEGQEIELR